MARACVHRRELLALLAGAAGSLGGPGMARAQDLDAVTRLLDAAVYGSQARRLLDTIADRFGPRLSGSPALRACQDWAHRELSSWGLSQVRFEAFPFGRAWEARSCSLALTAPHRALFAAVPVAWTPGLAQPVEADILRVSLETPADLAAARGTLRGKVLLLKPPGDLAPKPDAAPAPDLDFAAEAYALDAGRVAFAARYAFRLTLSAFLEAEGAVAVIDPSDHPGGVMHVEGENYRAGRSFPIPRVVTSAEAYNQLVRLAEGPGARVRLAVDVDFGPEVSERNVLAEITGQGRDPEVVLIGAHLDSWHAGTGASDNAAGVAVMMEAMRVLVRVGLKPRRTIRLALWSGEEQLMLGSSSHVARRLAARPVPDDPIQREAPSLTRIDLWPVSPQPENPRFSAYFNLDEGGGPIIGIEASENVAAAPRLARWMSPFYPGPPPQVSLARSYGSDHIAFDLFGLPAFNFLQAPTPGGAARYHTSLDVADHVRTGDLIRNAAIVAGVAFAAAQDPERMPRKPFLREAPVSPAS